MLGPSMQSCDALENAVCRLTIAEAEIILRAHEMLSRLLRENPRANAAHLLQVLCTAVGGS